MPGRRWTGLPLDQDRHAALVAQQTGLPPLVAAILASRGIGEEEAVALLVNGFVREVLQELPMEFAVEAQKLLSVSLEGSVG